MFSTPKSEIIQLFNKRLNLTDVWMCLHFGEVKADLIAQLNPQGYQPETFFFPEMTWTIIQMSQSQQHSALCSVKSSGMPTRERQVAPVQLTVLLSPNFRFMFYATWSVDDILTPNIQLLHV